MKFQRDLQKNGFAIIRKALNRKEFKRIVGMDLKNCLEYCCTNHKVRHYFTLLYDDIDVCFDKGLLQQKYRVSENRYIWPNYYFQGLLFVYNCPQTFINGKYYSFAPGDLIFVDPKLPIDVDEFVLELPLKPAQSFAPENYCPE
jgi:hypothetical protein